MGQEIIFFPETFSVCFLIEIIYILLKAQYSLVWKYKAASFLFAPVKMALLTFPSPGSWWLMAYLDGTPRKWKQGSVSEKVTACGICS